MERNKVPAWLPFWTFSAKGPRYLVAYATWRLRRLAARWTERAAPSWPAASEVERSLSSAAGTLADYFASRSEPKSLAPWSEREAIIATVDENARQKTIERAESICERRFCFRGQEVSFPGEIDWQHCPGGNTDWTWDLNRHHYFVDLGRAYWYTGEERFVDAFRAILTHWMECNPPAAGSSTWRSVFEVGVRLTNWCWAHALFSRALDDRQQSEILRGILGTARFLQRHLERHAWNNHLLLEAKSLAMAGVLFPELPGAASWRDDGLRVVHRELDRQLAADGVHNERSTFYHKLIASELLEQIVVMRLGGRDSDVVEAAFARLVEFLAAITRSDGSIPLLGDASRHDGHVRFDALRGAAQILGLRQAETSFYGEQESYCQVLQEGTAWLTAVSRSTGVAVPADGSQGGAVDDRSAVPSGERRSTAFPDGGFWILQADCHADSPHLMFDCGPFGDSTVVGHGHADALSIDLAVGDCHALVDPGMYSAHLGVAWRNYFRGTAAHNTIRVDGADQSLLEGVRRVYYPAQATARRWYFSNVFDVVEGEHQGYQRLPDPVLHRRRVFFVKPSCYLMTDRLSGPGTHSHELLFHLPPSVAPELGEAGFSFRQPSGRGLLAASSHPSRPQILVGEESPPQGWVAYFSGAKVEAPVLVFTAAGALPFDVHTLLVPLTSTMRSPPVVERIAVVNGETGEPRDDGFAAQLRFEDGSVLWLTAAPLARTMPRSYRVANVETDAGVSALFFDAKGVLSSAVVFDGTFLERESELLVGSRGRVPTTVWYDGGRWNEASV